MELDTIAPPTKDMKSMHPLSRRKPKTFLLTAYQPYIVDFVWKLKVPGASVEDAIEKVAVVMRNDDALMPKEWVLKSGYDDDGTDMPSLHGKTGWEVTDKECNDDIAAKPDTSGQRAFVWSFDSRERANTLEITPVTTGCIPYVCHNVFGVLVAEAVSPVLNHVPEPTHIMIGQELVNGITGQEFWCVEDSRVYRVLWAFKNPQ